MNILYVNHYAGSVQHGMEYRPFYMAREWRKSGHRVRIVAASHSHVRAIQPPVVDALEREEIEDIEYFWIKTPPYSGNGLGRIRNMLAFVSGLYRHSGRLTAGHRPDVVIASSTYPLDVFPCARIARKADARLIFELHDLWPLSPMELGSMSPWHPFIVTMQRGEDFACRNADAVVSMLPKAEKHLASRGLPPGRFHYVPNGIDISGWTADSEPLAHDIRANLERLRAGQKLLVGYAGAHGLANALEHLVEAARLTRGEPIAYVLVGQGPEKAHLQNRASDLGLNNVLFLPAVPKAQMPAFLDEMGALFIGLQRKPIFRFGISPNKLMDYMMAGKPVIHAIEAGNDMVSDSGCGISIPAEDAGAIADAVRRLAATGPDERAQMGERGRRFVLKHHDYRILAKKLLEAIV